MSAIATVLAAMGHWVSGSDLKESPTLDRLRAAGLSVAAGHRSDHVGDVDGVTRSTAVPEDNPEVLEARRRGIPVFRRAETLAAIAATRRCVAVAGTHGKTTTASMLALILIEAGIRPSFLIGGEVNEIGTNAVWDEGEWLVVEADESDGSFLSLQPEVAVVTNVEPDHLDHYGDFERVRDAFDQFLASAPSHRVVGADDEVSAELGRRYGAWSAGVAAGAMYRMADLVEARSEVAFDLVGPDGLLGRLTLPVPGMHNARNAAVAAVAALAVGAPFAVVSRALARFAGVARRFEFRGAARGVTFVDDYAHLPTEVDAALEAAGSGGWGRVVAVFQPHRFSRTAALWQDFGDKFARADTVVVTDVYPAGERPLPGISGHLVAEAIRAADPERAVVYAGSRAELRSTLIELLVPGDLCLTLGAGDLTSLPDELLAAFEGTG